MSLKKLTQRAAAGVAALTTSLGPAGAVSVALVQPACGIFGSPGPSAVGQGRQYQSGDPSFDQFFAQLYELQVEVAKAPGREKEIRQDIAKATKSDPDAAVSLMAKKVDKRAQELAETGTGLALNVEGLDGNGEVSVALESVGKELSEDDKSYFEGVEKAAKDEAKLLERMRTIPRLIEQMHALSITLDQRVDTAFRKGGPSKKSEVRKNLEDARTLMPLMSAKAQETADAAKGALRKLAEAVATKDSYKKVEPPPEMPPEPPPEEGGTKTEPKPKPKPGPAPGPGTSGQPQPKPEAPKPPPDFEP